MGLSKSNALRRSTPEPPLLETKWPWSPRTSFHLQRFYYQEAFSAILSLEVVSFGICLANLLSVLSVSV